MKAPPKHARERYKKIEENTETLLAMAKDHSKYNYHQAGYLIHDILTDAHVLAMFADSWIDFCRKTGQHPFRKTNDDASVNSKDADIDWSTYR